MLLAAGVQIITSFMQNENGFLPSKEKCHQLTQQFHSKGFNSFKEFYPFYLCEHGIGITKLFHFIASANVLAIFARLMTRKWQTKLFLFGFVQAYGLAWFSHFFIEHNRPATWTYPTYSFYGDFKMFVQILTFKFPPFVVYWLDAKIYRHFILLLVLSTFCDNICSF